MPSSVARVALLLGLAVALVDENGRYQSGHDITSLAPPEPTEADKSASVDLSKQPIEKLFRLLAYELMKEEERLPDLRLGVRDFQVATELGCQERLVLILQETQNISEEVHWYHLNVTGTAGLYWLLHEYPEEHSWAWLLPASHDKVIRRVSKYLLAMAAVAADDQDSCLSEGFRAVLMNAAVTWKKIHGDYDALLWNGVAFGALGDVTSWREVDEDGQAENGPGGPPPNVSWSENVIFGNMWISSVQKWLEHHAQEVLEALQVEVARMRAGILPGQHKQWSKSEDGVVSSFECMRRQIFGGWQVDKGLLRGLLRHCLRPDYSSALRPSVADFGAGGGGYSQWLNDTGLAEAFAFDAANSIYEITRGAVLEVNLGSAVELWRKFDWVLCLEVAAHVPEPQARALLGNAARHALRGLVVSWAAVGGDGGAAGGLEAPFVSLVEEETGFLLDRGATLVLREGCEFAHIARTVVVFRAPS